ncbi:MAG TPA: TonB-dependent receptor [Lysobacter sp.]
MAKSGYIFAICGALSICFGGSVRAGEAKVSSRTTFALRAGALDDALRTLATQSRVQILYAPELVAGVRTAGLRAQLSPVQALERLLSGTGLQAFAVNANTYVLQRAPVPTTRPAATPVAIAPRRNQTPTELATVQVTGSRIPRSDLDAVTPSPLTLICRDEIETSGHQTLFELLRNQPGMAGHHPVDVAADGGQGLQQPFAAAATTSLNALGPRATLFLIDGRRVANYGLVSADLGGLTDLDAIPLSIVDRIEIIRGGASAIYGADAMAGVVNIILRKQQVGAEVVARYGVSDRGDAAERRLSMSVGKDTRGGGDVFLAADHFQRDALLGSQREWRSMDHRRHDLGDWRFPLGYRDADLNLVKSYCSSGVAGLGADCMFDPPRWSTLQPATERLSLYAHWRQPLGKTTQFYAQVRASDSNQRLYSPPFHARVLIPEDHPDAIPGTEQLDYGFFDLGPIRTRSHTRALSVSSGLEGRVGNWEWNAGVSHDENSVTSRIDGLLRYTAFENALFNHTYRFGAPDNPASVLAAISPRVTARGKAVLDQASAGINGTWFTMPAGEAKLAAGIEFSRDALLHNPDQLMLENDVALGPQKIRIDEHRHASALYAELSLPLARRLQADLAARFDYRQGYGGNLSPKLGLRWNVLDSLTLRGTAATGYRAPSLFELRRPLVFDSLVLVRQTPALEPCRYPWSFAPGSVYCVVNHSAIENPHLRPETSRSRTLGLVWSPSREFSVSLDYFRIERRNEILPGNAAEDPVAFPRSIERDDTGLLVGINDYFENVGRTDVRGWEVEARYGFDTQRFGRYSLSVAGQYVDHVMRQSHPNAPVLDHAGHGAPDRSMLAAVQWAYSDWTTTLNLQGFGPTRVNRAGEPCPKYNDMAGHCTTPGATTLDLNLAYSGIANWHFALNVRDLRDRQPLNYDIEKGGYDIARDDPRGRYYLLSAAYRF